MDPLGCPALASLPPLRPTALPFPCRFSPLHLTSNPPPHAASAPLPFRYLPPYTLPTSLFFLHFPCSSNPLHLTPLLFPCQPQPYNSSPANHLFFPCTSLSAASAPANSPLHLSLPFPYHFSPPTPPLPAPCADRLQFYPRLSRLVPLLLETSDILPRMLSLARQDVISPLSSSTFFLSSPSPPFLHFPFSFCIFLTVFGSVSSPSRACFFPFHFRPILFPTPPPSSFLPRPPLSSLGPLPPPSSLPPAT